MAKQKAWVTFFEKWGKIFCLIFIAMSAAVIAFGSKAYTAAKSAEEAAPTFAQLNIQSTALILLVIGCFALFASLVGAYGFFRRRVKILQLYAVFIGVMCLLQLGLGAYLVDAKVTNNDSAINTRMVDAAVVSGDPSQLISFANFFQCCDWTVNNPWRLSGSSFNCRGNPGYQEYCLESTATWLSDQVGIVSKLTVAVSVVEIFGVIGTCLFVFGRAKQPTDDDDF